MTQFSTTNLKKWEKDLVQSFPFLFKEPSLGAVMEFCSIFGCPPELPVDYCNLRHRPCIEEKYKNKLYQIFGDLTDLLWFFREKPEEEFSFLEVYCCIKDIKQLKNYIKLEVEKSFPGPIDRLVDQYLEYKTRL